MNFKRKSQANGPVSKRRRTQEPTTRHGERPIQMPRELSFEISRSLTELNNILFKQRQQQQRQRLRYAEERRQMIQRILDLYNMGALLFTEYTELMNLTFNDAIPNSNIRQIIQEREVQDRELMNESENESESDDESSYENLTRVFWEGRRHLADEEGDVFDIDGNHIITLRYQRGAGIVSMTTRAPR